MARCSEAARRHPVLAFERADAHLFAADAQGFGDDLDEAAVAQTQFGAGEVQAHLAAEVLGHQLHGVAQRNKLSRHVRVTN